MSNYTPTTEEVRSHYSWSCFDNGTAFDLAGKDFDRWLADVKAKAFADGAVAGYNDAIQNTYTTNPYITNE